MRLENLKRGKQHPRCEAGCKTITGGNNLGYRPARHRFWLLGRHVFLCGPCGQAWKRAYEDARDGWSDDEREAA